MQTPQRATPVSSQLTIILYLYIETHTHMYMTHSDVKSKQIIILHIKQKTSRRNTPANIQMGDVDVEEIHAYAHALSHSIRIYAETHTHTEIVTSFTV